MIIRQLRERNRRTVREHSGRVNNIAHVVTGRHIAMYCMLATSRKTVGGTPREILRSTRAAYGLVSFFRFSYSPPPPPRFGHVKTCKFLFAHGLKKIKNFKLEETKLKSKLYGLVANSGIDVTLRLNPLP